MHTSQSLEYRTRFVEFVNALIEESSEAWITSQKGPVPLDQGPHMAVVLRLAEVDVTLLHNDSHSPERVAAFFAIGEPRAADARRMQEALLRANSLLGTQARCGYCKDAHGRLHFFESFALDSMDADKLQMLIAERYRAAMVAQQEFSGLS